MRRILVVDDDKKIVDLICRYLEREGFLPLRAYDGSRALDLFRVEAPELVVLDIMLPGISGLDLCSLMRAEKDVPILMVTAKTTEQDRVAGLNRGSDDYLCKPFSPAELVARVKALLRRCHSRTEERTMLTVGDLEIDFPRHSARIGGEALDLTPIEFSILSVMAGEPERVFTRADLLDKAMGYPYGGLDRTVDSHIKNLRRKIGRLSPNHPCIRTVFGIGYALSLEAGNGGSDE